MAGQRINETALRWFGRYVRFYLRRNFHAVRLAGQYRIARLPELPVVVCLNHPSWWDPLIALHLSRACMPERSHYAPIESAALAKYAFFEKLGFFGIEPGTARGATAFLRTGASLLDSPRTALWVTAQGHFADVRQRPADLRGGVGHLIRRLTSVVVVPLAIEYPFWDERYPEALAMWGEPLVISDPQSRTPGEWTEQIARSLEETQDALAASAVRRDGSEFETLLGGSAGVGGVYDLWRGLKARLRGRRFNAAHGGERL